jgi:hypothetical protein
VGSRCTLSLLLNFATYTVDPATSIKFPTVLRLEGEPEMTLLGVGVRTVSFLSIRVYSVGFYADLANVDLKVSFDSQQYAYL